MADPVADIVGDYRAFATQQQDRSELVGSAVGEDDALFTHAQLLAEKRIGFFLLTVGLILYLGGLVATRPRPSRSSSGTSGVSTGNYRFVVTQKP